VVIHNAVLVPVLVLYWLLVSYNVTVTVTVTTVTVTTVTVTATSTSTCTCSSTVLYTVYSTLYCCWGLVGRKKLESQESRN
jgi:hypothetical protein